MTGLMRYHSVYKIIFRRVSANWKTIHEQLRETERERERKRVAEREVWLRIVNTTNCNKTN
jgi:hypothetical protein